MKSPITGGNASLIREPAKMVFRNEEYEYVYSYYRCEDTGETFTTTAMDDVNIAQVYNQYRIRYGIPFPDEIRAMRQSYGLPAIKMSRILGWGDNQYRLYENGDMPSPAHGKTLTMIRKPQYFLDYVNNAHNQLDGRELARIQSKITSISPDNYERFVHEYVFGRHRIGIENGFATQSIVKLRNVLLFYIREMGGVFFTRMNKQLFYSDFVNYREYGRGLTGLSYEAIQFGPVPIDYTRVYSLSGLRVKIVSFDSGHFGQRLESDLQPDMTVFSDNEKRTMNNVVLRFRDTNAGEISDISHEEEAWVNYIDSGLPISYNEAFTLKAL